MNSPVEKKPQRSLDEEAAEAPHGQRLRLDTHIPVLLSHVANMLTASAARTYSKHHGLAVTEWRLLNVLAAEPDVLPARVCQLTGINKSSVSRAANSLIKRRLITVTPDPTDPRKGVLALTKAGYRLHGEAIVTSIARDELLMSGISCDERMTFVKLLKQMDENVPLVAAYRPPKKKFGA
jgi:DNA-binding MarR family transcriptional regulator